VARFSCRCSRSSACRVSAPRVSASSSSGDSSVTGPPTSSAASASAPSRAASWMPVSRHPGAARPLVPAGRSAQAAGGGGPAAAAAAAPRAPAGGGASMASATAPTMASRESGLVQKCCCGGDGAGAPALPLPAPVPGEAPAAAAHGGAARRAPPRPAAWGSSDRRRCRGASMQPKLGLKRRRLTMGAAGSCRPALGPTAGAMLLHLLEPAPASIPNAPGGALEMIYGARGGRGARGAGVGGGVMSANRPTSGTAWAVGRADRKQGQLESPLVMPNPDPCTADSPQGRAR
jgi:hypothetical protein